ncbi:SUR7-domain-containing protein [Pseudovirgaria hyperparasitica]|uniref:SUR7-domain-containing protein n=1 Tax=Pseudovirgaria hyperparasitica TaxID=470096 RepID=A0A6A6W453_9PEZI|nr:SUR7-domain-containing protein [Pseudovirgaria hyperparasitica]KAF2757335.1 SUR7-domain-containing protein [Pseudovirgaria hyperparasitica]
MAAARPIVGLVSLIILAGGILLQFFIILSGSINSSPENLVYFLQATTNGISNARNPTRWTYFALCGVDGNNHNTDCGSPVPALPFDPKRNFGTTDGIPESLMSGNRYYLLSRFSWVFFLVALIFSILTLLTALLALCSRLGAFLTSGLATLAFVFQALAAALMTSWVIMGRNAFRSSGQDASIGRYAMGFAWASVACFLINMVLGCIGGVTGGKSDSTSYKAPRKGFFGRKQSTRSRGSFRDNRIKDDYS